MVENCIVTLWRPCMQDNTFSYKQESRFRQQPVRLEKSLNFIFLIGVLFIGFFGLFFAGYKHTDHFQKPHKDLLKTSSDPFLVRVLTKDGFQLARVKVDFFTQNLQVLNEIRQETNQYKKHILFFLSQVKEEDFSTAKKKALQEKIKNHINSFLSYGKVQEIVIESHFIKGGLHV